MWQYFIIVGFLFLILYFLMHLKVKLIKVLFKFMVFIFLIFLVLFAFDYFNDNNSSSECFLATGASVVDNIRERFNKEEISELADELKTLKKNK